MSKRLLDSDEFPVNSRVEVLLAGTKKLRGKIAWSILSEVPGYAAHTAMRVNYDHGGWYVFVVTKTGESVCEGVLAKISVITNEGAQLELL